MASTYSPSLRIQLIETGTEFEAWGAPTDNNLGTVIEQAITGVESVSIANLTSYSLTTANAAVDQARNAVIILTGNLDANCDVIVPSVEKVYIVNNQTSNSKVVTLKTSGGNGVQIASGGKQLVYCNGVDVNSAIDVNNIIGNFIVSGGETLGGNLTAAAVLVNGSLTSNTGNITMTSYSNVVTMKSSTGGFVFPSGTSAQRPETEVLGMSRWNTSLGWYEIWNGTDWQQITGSFNVSYLIAAGGGGGGGGTNAQAGGGGGGAGGVIEGSATLAPSTSYTITVGSGGGGGLGASTVGGSNGVNSSAFTFTAIGGGGGACNSDAGFANGNAGGSGGGGYGNTAGSGVGGSGTSGQGFAGAATPGGDYGGGGGGGSAVGSGYTGGAGLVSTITGSSVTYSTGGTGGIGGAGTSGTGNGGNGGVSPGSGGGGAGGSGVVIVSYAYPTQRATGGAVTSYSSGGFTYWVHTFTTSGTFAT